MTINDIDTEQFEKAKELIIKLGHAILKAYKPVIEEIQQLYDTLEPYRKFELAHPRKKPRGSIRRARRESRNDKRRNHKRT